MNTLLQIDERLFTSINGLLGNAWLDPVMKGITFIGEVPFVLIPLWGLFVWKEKKSGWIAGLFIIGLLILSDCIPTYLLKPAFARPRPLFVLDGVNQFPSFSDEISPFGFPSNHATNIFAVAMFLALYYRTRLVWLVAFGLSGLVAFSRVYVGVHYPLDVAAGAVLGTGIGLVFYWMWRKTMTKLGSS